MTAIIISLIILIGFFGILLSVNPSDTTYQHVPIKKSHAPSLKK